MPRLMASPFTLTARLSDPPGPLFRSARRSTDTMTACRRLLTVRKGTDSLSGPSRLPQKHSTTMTARGFRRFGTGTQSSGVKRRLATIPDGMW